MTSGISVKACKRTLWDGIFVLGLGYHEMGLPIQTERQFDHMLSLNRSNFQRTTCDIELIALFRDSLPLSFQVPNAFFSENRPSSPRGALDKILVRDVPSRIQKHTRSFYQFFLKNTRPYTFFYKKLVYKKLVYEKLVLRWPKF